MTYSPENFEIYYDEWLQMQDEVARTVEMTAGSSVDDVMEDEDGYTYFHDTDE